jgi:hypothetical protein
MRTSKWSIEDWHTVVSIGKDETLTNKEKTLKLRKLFPSNSVVSLSRILNLHRRTIHRYLIE